VPDLLSGTQFSLDESQLTAILSREGPVLIEDVGTDPRLNSLDRELLADLHAHSLAQFPLIAGGLWFGVFVIHWDTAHTISEEDVRHIRGLVDQAAAAINNILLLRAEAAARRAAETANALKLKFLAMISHELRTPLTSIKGFSTSLLQQDVTWDADNQRDFIEIINREADNLANLVEQLLDMTALQAGSMRIEQRQEDFQSILDDAMPQLIMLSEHHDLVVDIPDALPAIRADRYRITQVLSNLVANACRYSPPNTRIEIAACSENGSLHVMVSDQGPGILPSDREAVFEAFRQADNRPNKTRGLGLGLAIAKGIVEAHGGAIWIEDSSEAGTTVSFTLPLQRQAEPT
jgi:two-component system sensor histidine kinase KdpD